MAQAIEKLRKLVETSTPPTRLTAVQVFALIDGLKAVKPLADIASDVGVPESEVLDLTAEFGTWLTHVNGGSNAELSFVVELEQQLSFDIGPPVLSNVFTDPQATPTVSVPLGFERTAPHGRDVAKALAAIVVVDPQEDVVTRFLARRYASTAKVLTFPLVASVWRFATLDRLDDLGSINPKNMVFNELLVSAYDMLEFARRDCNDAVRTLAVGDVSDLQALSDAAARCRWVNEGEITRLERSIEMAKASPSSVSLLTKELEFFQATVRARPDLFLVASIEDLTEAHVRRIGQAAGLAVDGENRSLESDIRRRLHELGLASDVDRLVPEGVRAASAGLTDTFWEAMSRRVDNDPCWDEDLLEAFELSDSSASPLF